LDFAIQKGLAAQLVARLKILNLFGDKQMKLFIKAASYLINFNIYIDILTFIYSTVSEMR
jgi:hypothetical protein